MENLLADWKIVDRVAIRDNEIRNLVKLNCITIKEVITQNNYYILKSSITKKNSPAHLPAREEKNRKVLQELLPTNNNTLDTTPANKNKKSEQMFKTNKKTSDKQQTGKDSNNSSQEQPTIPKTLNQTPKCRPVARLNIKTHRNNPPKRNSKKSAVKTSRIKEKVGL